MKANEENKDCVGLDLKIGDRVKIVTDRNPMTCGWSGKIEKLGEEVLLNTDSGMKMVPVADVQCQIPTGNQCRS